MPEKGGIRGLQRIQDAEPEGLMFPKEGEPPVELVLRDAEAFTETFHRGSGAEIFRKDAEEEEQAVA